MSDKAKIRIGRLDTVGGVVTELGRIYRFAWGGPLPQADGETQLFGPSQKVGESRIGLALFPFAELVSVDPNFGREISLRQAQSIYGRAVFKSSLTIGERRAT